MTGNVLYRLTVAALALSLGAAWCGKAPAEKRTRCTFEGFEPRGKRMVEILWVGHYSPYLEITPDAEGRVTFVLPKGADCDEFDAVAGSVRGKLVE